MRTMRSGVLLLLALVLGACEGGSRGSGITTEALGNVASVEVALRHSPESRSKLARLIRLLAPEASAVAEGSVEGIHVSIEGTSIVSDTDANGVFSLRGHFEGDVVIRFESPTVGATGRMAVNIPAAGTLTLHDVTIDGRSGEATAQSTDVAFDGLVASADCPAEILRLVSSAESPPDTDVYAVDLDTSSLHDAGGMPVACEQLTVGESVQLTGSVNADGTFGDCEIVVAP
jgi:hypothetical protein